MFMKFTWFLNVFLYISQSRPLFQYQKPFTYNQTGHHFNFINSCFSAAVGWTWLIGIQNYQYTQCCRIPKNKSLAGKDECYPFKILNTPSLRSSNSIFFVVIFYSDSPEKFGCRIQIMKFIKSFPWKKIVFWLL